MPHSLYVTRGSGNRFKPALLLRQTGKACAVRCVDGLSGESRRPEFPALSPQGQVPFLVLDAGRGRGESHAIAGWLAEGTPLMPVDPFARARGRPSALARSRPARPGAAEPAPERACVHHRPRLQRG
jgi:glutathione S-transferase